MQQYRQTDNVYKSIFARLRMLPAMAIAAVLASCFTCACHAADPITMEDLLHAEGLGDAVFSPDGNFIAYTRSIALDSRKAWGYDDASVVGERVFVTARAGAPAREILAPAEIHYRLLPEKTWSPDGRGLLLLAAGKQGFNLAYWDANSAKVSPLSGQPYNEFAPFDWLGDRLVYSILPKGGYQGRSDMQILAGINRKWRGTWESDTAEVTVSSGNDAFKSSAPAPGALMFADPRSGQAVKISDGDFVAVFASPDHQHFAAIRTAEAVPDSFYFLGTRGELQLFERTANGVKLVHSFADLDVSYATMAWSPKGDRLLVGGKPATAGKVDTRLYEIEARTGRSHEIRAAGLSFVTPQLEHMGGLLQLGWLNDVPMAVAAHQGDAMAPAAEAPKGTARLEYGETKNLRFDVYAFDRGSAQNLTAFAKTSVENFVAPANSSSAFAVADGALWRVALGHKEERIAVAGEPTIVGFGTDKRYPEPDPITAYSQSAEFERLALYVLDAQHKPQRTVLDLKSGQLDGAKIRGDLIASSPDHHATVSRVNDGWSTSLVLNEGGERLIDAVNSTLKNRAVASAQLFNYAFNGKELTGWLLLPPNAKLGVALPAIVDIYGGIVYGAQTPSAAKPVLYGSPMFNMQLLAAHGYAVILPSTPLGAGAETDLMGTLAGEVIAAIDTLAARGVVDPKRVGVTGQSFGGFSTAAILAARSDRFKAGVAMAGVYDWIYGYGVRALGETLTDDGRAHAVEMKMIETGQSRLGEPFWKTPEAYMRNSPIFQVDKIDAPLLLLHGDLDMGVTGLSGAERMYNALIRAGKKPALVHYWGEGHVAQSAASIRDQWMRMTMWFDTYVKSR